MTVSTAAVRPIFYYPVRYGLENYSYIFPFERSFDSDRSTLWMQRNWFHSITLSVAYVMLIYLGQRLMKHRKPLDLQQPLAYWNLGLAIFSIMGVVRMTPEFIWAIGTKGFEYSMCSTSYAQGVTGFWTEMFALSKVAEFLDTGFIVLRKRPLIFLHWYHHVTVLMYTWHAYKDHTASGRWFIWMNYTVHAVMYSYYALRSFHIRFPKQIPMLVTTLQITQMVFGIIIAINAYRIKLQGGECQQTYENLYFSFTIYFTYFLLFCNFFYHAYLKKNNRYAAATKKFDEKAAVRNGHVANGDLAASSACNGTANGHLAANGHTSNGHVANGYKSHANGHVHHDKGDSSNGEVRNGHVKKRAVRAD